MLTIDITPAQDLSDRLKYVWGVEQGNYSSYMAVKHNDEIIFVTNDYMEPGDATFLRDLQWVKEIILRAYKLGQQEGR